MASIRQLVTLLFATSIATTTSFSTPTQSPPPKQSNSIIMNDESSSSSSSSCLLPILAKALPTVVSYHHLDHIVQANAEGARILARHSSAISEKLENDDDDNEDNSDCSTTAIQKTSSTDDSRLLVTASEELLEETELFLKRVTASSYTHKSWTDMRRTLVYLRTEVRFYNEIVPLLLLATAAGDGSRDGDVDGLALQNLIPNCFHAAYDLDGLVNENAPATDVNAPSPFADASTKDDNDETQQQQQQQHQQQQQQILQNKGGHILLQSLSQNHFQDSPISPTQSLACLAAVAELHASAMGNIPLLQTINDRLSGAGGSYHLKFRNPKELQNVVSSWEAFRGHFLNGNGGDGGDDDDGDDDDGAVAVKGESGKDWTFLLEKESVVNLGQRVRDMAEYVSEELTPGLEEEYATLVHGDFKAMNVFLPAELKEETNNNDDKNNKKDKSSGGAIMIDFSCAGIGFGMSDIAMHIVHAVLPHDLENGGEERLVEGYLLALEDAMYRKHGKKWTFPRNVAQRHYQLACIDYLRFIMGRFWRSATPEAFEKKKNSRNTTLINRNVDSAMAFIEKVDRYLEVFEKEKKDSGR